jgi:hypothetical protein
VPKGYCAAALAGAIFFSAGFFFACFGPLGEISLSTTSVILLHHHCMQPRFEAAAEFTFVGGGQVATLQKRKRGCLLARRSVLKRRLVLAG